METVHRVCLGITPQPVKSSYSTGYNNCVMIASPSTDGVEISDSKLDTSPDRHVALKISPAAFGAFTRSL